MRFLALAAAVRLVASLYTLVQGSQAGDIAFYYQMAALSDQGFHPFVHFWSEYPPLFPLLLTGAYRALASAGLASPERFTLAFRVMFIGIELANIALVYFLVGRAHGEKAARRAAFVYAGCPVLVWVSSGWFDPLAVLFSLAAVYALTSKRAATAGVLIALGVLTKIYPGVLLLAAPAALGWRGSRRLVLAMAGTLAAVLAPLALLRPDLLLASFASMATRGPWETLPAILSGYYGWGALPELQDRFTAGSAFLSSGTPTLLTLLPELVLLAAVGGAWFVTRRGRCEAREVYVLVALGVVTFTLGNKGYSPQFVAWLIPSVLLVWPGRTGLLYVALFIAHSLAYVQLANPPMRAYYQDGVGSIESVAAVVSVMVVLRTALLAWITCHLCATLLRVPERPRLPMPSLRRLAFSSSLTSQ